VVETQSERRLGGRAPTIALLVDWLEDEYQNTVMRGALDAARERRVNLVCLCGGVLDSPARNGVRRNRVFDLATPRSVDGVIVLSGTLGNFVGPARLAAYCARFRTLPRCSVGVPLAGMPSVLVDNAVGMREALTHLIDVHGKRRVLFVRGPEVNEEAERRFAVYCDVLSERSLLVDPELNSIGDFQPEAGYLAVCHALDRGVEIDAVAAANDSMALGALRALRERGVLVPEDVALVGFDDVEEARFLEPPLSTVQQPLYDQGKHAVRLVIAKRQGDPGAEEDVVLRTEFVVRRSCGCVPENALGVIHRTTARSMGFEASMIQRRSLVLAELLRAAQANFGRLARDWEARLFTAVLDELGERAERSFLSVYGDTLQQARQTESPINTWHEVLSALRRHVLVCVVDDPELYARAEDLFQQARIMTANVVERVQARKRIDAERLSRKMARAGAELIASFDPEALYAACAAQLPELGIRSCYLVLNEGRAGEPNKLVFAYDRDRSLEHAATVEFSVDAILPEEFLPSEEPYALIVVPLFFDAHQLGFATFGYGPQNGTVYESLRDQISAALYGAKLAERHGR
jgi:DNA-binding LacI/PurR family transcriptional regulator